MPLKRSETTKKAENDISSIFLKFSRWVPLTLCLFYITPFKVRLNSRHFHGNSASRSHFQRLLCHFEVYIQLVEIRFEIFKILDTRGID